MPRFRLALMFGLLVAFVTTASPISASPTAVTYYVASSTGNDSHDGLSEANAFATIAKVNALNLQPGDRVLLKCGDVWQAQRWPRSCLARTLNAAPTSGSVTHDQIHPHLFCVSSRDIAVDFFLAHSNRRHASSAECVGGIHQQ